MEYFEHINAFLLQIPLGVAVVMAITGMVSFMVMFTQFGRTKTAMLVCIPGHTAGAIGVSAWMTQVFMH